MSTTTFTGEKKSQTSGFTIERTAKRMKQVYQQMLKAAKSDITVDQWVILQELDRSGTLGQNEIARHTFKDAPTVTRIIDILCKKGLTTRSMDPDDRRKFLIELTEEGQEKIQEVLPTVQAFRQKAYENLEDEEVKQLMNILNKIFDNLQ